MRDNDRLRWIYSSRDSKELSRRYAKWAEDYDGDLEDGYGWQAPVRAAGFAVRYVSKGARVLDAGAGTGLVGQCLHQRGYHNLVAIDLSEEMLAKAREKKVYRELYQMVLGEPLDFPDHCFDAVVCIGVLTFAHAPVEALDELIRVTRPTGHVLFSLRTDVYENLGFKEKLAELENSQRWELVEVGEPFRAFAKKEPLVHQHVWVYRIIA